MYGIQNKYVPYTLIDLQMYRIVKNWQRLKKVVIPQISAKYKQIYYVNVVLKLGHNIFSKENNKTNKHNLLPEFIV